MTADLSARVAQHRNGSGSAVCERYGLKRLVLTEHQGDITLDIACEKALKAWKRDWKIRLIEASNPDWRDLSNLVL